MTQGASPALDQETIIKKALLELRQAKAKIQALEQAQSEPIAIIGMSCRFPGGATSPEAFWQILSQGIPGTSEVPADRWDLEKYYDPDPEVSDKMYTRGGGFLKEPIEDFDPLFFEMSPREAVTLDPQQRMLLEVSWEALEYANMSSDQLFNSLTGVFIGISGNDYRDRVKSMDQPESVAYLGTGTALSTAAGRLSFFLGLTGPSLIVDTACSSSLVAIHLACQSLRQQECHQALVGGVNLILSPETNIVFCRAGMLSPDDRCKTFDAAANGYTRGEGCGILVLKRLTDAQRDGNRILAVIRGSAVNQDGRSGGLTVPNGPAQEAVIRKALSLGGLKPEQIDYIEAHGTGTSLGDPIEVGALGDVFGSSHTKQKPLLLGSVKTNIGHLEAAAGVAGVMKVVLALTHQQIPQHIHFQTPNPYIPWDQLPVKVVTEATHWSQDTAKSRLAGISSFGFSGTNAHVILEEAPKIANVAPQHDRPLHLLPLSAKTPTALSQLAQRYRELLLHHQPELDLGDICHTAAVGRTHFKHRLAVISASLADLTTTLDTLNSESNVVLGQAQESPTIAILFTGQGSQYVGMGRQLYETLPTFKATLDQCSQILKPYLDRPLVDILYGLDSNTDTLDQTAYTQPALFALEYALYQVWQSWGIRPTAVMGHSVGEYVAACVAGVFSLEEGLKLIATRGKLMQQLPGNGVMVALMAASERVKAAIEARSATVSIAAVNGPESTVISGTAADIQAVVDELELEGIKSKTLQVSHAFHSPLMQPMVPGFDQVAQQVTYALPQMDLISNVTGQIATAAVATPEYWSRHILSPVRFAQGIATLQELGCNIFLECGPKPTLLGMGRQCLAEDTGVWLPTLRPPQQDWQQLLTSLATLYVQGCSIDWAGWDQDYPHRQQVSLPTYPFQRERYWVEAHDKPEAQAKVTLHPLVNHQLVLAGPSQDLYFETHLSAHNPAYLADHQIKETVILPGAAYIEMALVAGTTALKANSLVLENISIEQVLVLDFNQETTLQIILSPLNSESYRFEIASLRSSQGSDWQVHASGTLKVESLVAERLDLNRENWSSGSIIDLSTFYQTSQEQGITFGPCFQALHQVWTQSGKGYAQVQLPTAVGLSQLDRYRIHPVLLDASFQLAGTALNPSESSDTLYIPVGIDRLEWYQPAGSKLWVQSTLQGERLEDSLKSDLMIVDEAGTLVAKIKGFTLRRVDHQSLQRLFAPNLKDWLYTVDWQLQPSQSEQHAIRSWLIFRTNSSLSEPLIQQLQAEGSQCIQVSMGSSYEQLSPSHYQINPADPNDLHQLLSTCWHESNLERGIIYLALHNSIPELTPTQLKQSQLWGCGGVLHLIQALDTAQLSASTSVWIMTQGAQAIQPDQSIIQVEQTPLWGLGRVIELEYPQLRCYQVDLDPAGEMSANLSVIQAELKSSGSDKQIAYRQGQRYVARLTSYHDRQSSTQNDQLQVPTTQPYQLRLTDYGSPDHLTLATTQRRPPNANEVEIRMKAVGLNFRDVLNSLGVLKDYYAETLGISQASQLTFGFEGTGTVVRVGDQVSHLKVGDDVWIVLVGDAFSSYITTAANLVVKKPDFLSFTAGATIPLVFLTADYGLSQLAQLQPGERVLIHAAAGGVGQAAIQIAQHIGADIYATASPGKWGFLQSQGIQHIFNSRTLEFADQIKAATEGAGVDVVLNSLTGETIPKSLELLGPGGRFIEIGKAGIWSEAQIHQHRPDVVYYPFDLGEVSQAQPQLIQQRLAWLQQVFEQKEFQPLQHQIYSLGQVKQAFRMMQRGQHLGKVVVTLPQTEPQPIKIGASYLITGGLGSLGLEMAEWLADQGCRHLVLVGRRPATDEAHNRIAQLERLGVQITIKLVDITDLPQVKQLWNQMKQELPPLRGLIHAAGVLADGLLQQMSWPQFEQVMQAKVYGTWILHQLTQDQDLDFFICFSSISGLIGNIGQGNYAAANAFMDTLMHYRHRQGLPGLSLQWGPWEASGMAASVQGRVSEGMQATGIQFISHQLGRDVLSQLLGAQVPTVAVMPINWSTFSQHRSVAQFPFLEQFLIQQRASTSTAEFLTQLQSAATADREQLLTHHIQQEIAKVLGLVDPSIIELQQRLFDFGLDSLMAVELRNRLQRNLDRSLRSTLLFDFPTLEKLVVHLLAELGFSPTAQVDAAPISPDQTQAEQTRAEVEDLSAEDLAAMLSQTLAEVREDI